MNLSLQISATLQDSSKVQNAEVIIDLSLLACSKQRIIRCTFKTLRQLSVFLHFILYVEFNLESKYIIKYYFSVCENCLKQAHHS